MVRPRCDTVAYPYFDSMENDHDTVGEPSMFMTRAIMSSFSWGLLIATINVIAAKALLEMFVSLDLSSSSLFLLRKVTNRAAAERLLPSASG